MYDGAVKCDRKEMNRMEKKNGQKRNRAKTGYHLGMALSALAVQGMTVAPLQVFADELTFSGYTSISTVDYYLDIDTFSTELTVEEVYVESGSQVEEGDALLKLTEDSYQDALCWMEYLYTKRACCTNGKFSGI